MKRLRATSAAPTYFKSFFHGPTKLTFNDGGIKFNNPVFIADQERKILWPTLAKHDPDLLLSIGTGFHASTQASSINPGPESEPGINGYLRRKLKLVLDAIQDNLDCEKAWSNFIERLSLPEDEERRKKYQRLNPSFPYSLPKLDEFTQMEKLQQETRASFLQYPRVYELVADTLIASLFFFEMQSTCTPATEPDDYYNCKGT